MIGTTLIVSEPLTGYAGSHIEPPSRTPWPGGPRREFERAAVIAIGKLKRHGDFVARFAVRLVDGAELLVIGTEQSADDRRWLARLGKKVPLVLTSRDSPWTLSWVAV